MLELSLAATTAEELAAAVEEEAAVDDCSTREDEVVDSDWTLTAESRTAPTSASPDICLDVDKRDMGRGMDRVMGGGRGRSRDLMLY